MGRRTGRLKGLANFQTSLAEAEESLDLQNLEEMDDVEYQNALLQIVSDNIDAAERSELIDPDQAQELRSELLEEHRQRLEEIYDLDEDDDEDEDEEGDDEEEEYSSATPLATFRAAAPVAETLLDLGSQIGYETVEDFAIDIADYLGIDDEDAIDLLTGEALPDEEMCAALADGFQLDDESYEGFASLVEAAISDAVGEEPADADEELAAVSYSQYQNDLKVQQLENQIAEFEAAKQVSGLLANLEREIDECVGNAWMPPYAKAVLLGDFDREDDRVAAFSEVCAGNGVDPEVELYAMQRVVDTFKRCFENNPIAQFGSSIVEPLDSLANADQTTVEQARANLKLRKSRVGVLAN